MTWAASTMLTSVPLTGPLVAVVAVLLAVCYFCRSSSNLPPGPRGIPILGSIPFLGKQSPQKSMAELSKVYGPVMSLYLGSILTVVLGDLDTIRKALQEMGDVFSGRPEGLTLRMDKDDPKNVIYASGQFWIEHRRFALSTLRDFGIGKAGLEPAILNEIHCFCEEISKMKGAPFDIGDLLFMSICNNIFILEIGNRFEYSDPKFLRLLRTLIEAMKEVSGTKPDVFLPWLRKIPGMNKLSGLERLRKYADYIQSVMVEHVESHKLTYQTGDRSNFIDAYFTERIHRRQQGQEDIFDDLTLALNLRFMFAAGTDTTSNTLLWSLLYMMLHPDIQRKVQQEIDDVIGRERMPSLEDRGRMPYTDATIMEIQRKTTVVPLGVPHSTLEDVSFNGYHIPKETFVFANLWAVHNDDKLYPDPASFRPERFINQEGKAVKPEHLITFGVGKRYCLGEPLARMELFLYFTSMLQKFTFNKPEGAVLYTEATGGIVEKPLPYQLCAVMRN